MANFFNNDEKGIEGVLSGAGKAVKPVAKSAADQTKFSQDLQNQFYGVTGKNPDQNGDQGIEDPNQTQGKATADTKGKQNIRNPIIQQARANRHQKYKALGKSDDDIQKLESLRSRLHQMQVADVLEPQKPPEEQQKEKKPIYYQILEEEEQKKQKKQEEKQEEAKKKEDLAVVQKRTAAERRPGAG